MGGCISEPVLSQCCIGDLCFECAEAFSGKNSNPRLYNDIMVGQDIVAITLIIICVWNVFLCYKSCKISKIINYKPGKIKQEDIVDNDGDNETEISGYIPWMRINNIVFAFSTAMFALIRNYLHLGKPVAIDAAIHNLCEWGFITFVIYKSKKEREWGYFIFLAWILLIITLINITPTFPDYLLIENITGIAVDILLPIIWFIMYLQNQQNSSSTKVKYMFLIAFWSHLVHLLFTIIPLVILHFTQNQSEFASRMLESMLYISAPISHILYTKFTSMHEKYIDIPSYNDPKQNPLRQYPDNVILKHPKFISHPTLKIVFWYIVSVVIGSLPTAIIPLLVIESNGGYCHTDDIQANIIGYENITSLCNLSDYENMMIGTTTFQVYDGTADAFEQYIESKDLVSAARNYNGNIFYHFTRHLRVENSYLFVEGWKSLELAREWINSDYVEEAFNNYTFQMIVDGELDINVNGYIPLSSYCDNYGDDEEDEEEEEEEDMQTIAIRHVYDSCNGCQSIWNSMSNLSNCDWILGCDHVEILDEENGERQWVLTNGNIFNNYLLYSNVNILNDSSLIYYNYSTYTLEPDHLYTISLVYDRYNYGDDKCVALIDIYTNTSIQSVDENYEYFSKYNIPFLQNLFNADCPQ